MGHLSSTLLRLRLFPATSLTSAFARQTQYAIHDKQDEFLQSKDKVVRVQIGRKTTTMTNNCKNNIKPQLSRNTYKKSHARGIFFDFVNIFISDFLYCSSCLSQAIACSPSFISVRTIFNASFSTSSTSLMSIMRFSIRSSRRCFKLFFKSARSKNTS